MKPWYRQFWPWFVIALPASAVVAGVATLVIALDNADSVVSEDWYRRGQSINQELARDAVAASEHISALLSVGPDGSVTVEVDGGGAPGAALKLELHHPTDPERDSSTELRSDGRGRFAGSIRRAVESAPGGAAPVVAGGTWDVSLQPLGGDWRLHARVSLPAEGVHLRAGS
ncbi:MAG: FixH family protein [Deltaproteobacteria bacterium]|nr:FixH family protein [Deltaproteobacteria bacterium]